VSVTPDRFYVGITLKKITLRIALFFDKQLAAIIESGVFFNIVWEIATPKVDFLTGFGSRRQSK